MCVVYDPNIHPARALELLSLRGLTDKELAAAFGIGRSTLYDWRRAHPELEEAVRQGKNTADDLVEGAAFKRAGGYTVEYTEEEYAIVAGKRVLLRVKCGAKHIPGDVTAQIFWLKNRRPDRWRDRTEHTGANGGPIEIANLTAEERQKRIDELIAKRRTGAVGAAGD